MANEATYHCHCHYPSPIHHYLWSGLLEWLPVSFISLWPLIAHFQYNSQSDHLKHNPDLVCFTGLP